MKQVFNEYKAETQIDVNDSPTPAETTQTNNDSFMDLMYQNVNKKRIQEKQKKLNLMNTWKKASNLQQTFCRGGKKDK